MMGWGNMWNYGYGSSFLGNGNYWWMGLIVMAMQLIFWIALIGIGVKLFHNHSSKAPVGHSKDSSLDLLRERYSRGEIDSEEYNRRKHDLSAE